MPEVLSGDGLCGTSRARGLQQLHCEEPYLQKLEAVRPVGPRCAEAPWNTADLHFLSRLIKTTSRDPCAKLPDLLDSLGLPSSGLRWVQEW